MSESFFIRWDSFVNVFIENGEVIVVSFDDRPCRINIKSKTAEMLKKDLEAYFNGETIDFSVYPVRIDASEFVTKVLKEVRKIPYGETITYKELAERVGSSPRAVGQALKKNPVPIIVPCHRVVAKNGLGGFSSGVEVKRKLLKLEGVFNF